MGTALSALVAQNGHKATIWTIEPDVVKIINNEHHNHKYLPKIELPAGVRATGDIAPALKQTNLVISALPTQVVASVVKNYVQNFTAAHLLLSVSKGFVKDTGETVCRRIRHIAPRVRVAALMGPLFANEIAAGVPCAAILAGANVGERGVFIDVLQSPVFRVQETDDVVGAEACGALKNIYAVFMGILAGLSYGWNTKSAFITKAIQEMAEVVEHLGGKRETVYGLAGLGDLVTTCFGEQSRNRRFGQALCKEKSIDKALQSVGQVVEGVKTLEVIDRVLKGYSGSLPLLKLIKRLVKSNGDPHTIIEQFFKKNM
ncbi:MAG: Glycerol-3-phosphate dehydrogenase [NAD(P)+] [Candidatus Magasanikbacteria bacterium GW2011_GWA2_45_39]|uniref:Glycerol-3-phosphate dehydrogenase [NAD(P)+] n=2 Tax=Candidatus Magasanikiibacteriota TaxID=1752731 RepID=A0A0G1MXI8_9BACT|nr:MAG: Glycerol-3-phosphate dehydrogenase [NAD(P)+] [Candidatus Magasanikbacteria bacterium GW2011_GWA2_45_39]KKU12887.1 MAG: Glycerol-3-phosphate dehydrogenase [NAD(P)+] [Candidatus Magasanikbacteria bacterium GW2011_GWC2_45_8]